MAGPAAASGQGGEPAGKPPRLQISYQILRGPAQKETLGDVVQPSLAGTTKASSFLKESSQPARRAPSPPAVLSRDLPPPTSPRTLYRPLCFPHTLPRQLPMRSSARSPRTPRLQHAICFPLGS